MLIKLLPISTIEETEGINYFVGNNLLRQDLEMKYDIIYLNELYHSKAVEDALRYQGLSWYQYVVLYLVEKSSNPEFYKILENIIRQSSEKDVNIFFMKENSEDDIRKILYYLFLMLGCKNVIML